MRSRTAAGISLLVLLLCAVVCAQASSLACDFHQHSGSQHCCGLCHTGPLPLIQPSLSTGIVPAFASVWLDRQDRPGAPRDALLTAGSSRAPPAC